MSVSRAYPMPSKAARRAPSRLKGANLVFALVALIVLALTLAVNAWGVVVLTLAALLLVPVMFALFIWISLP